MVNRRIGWHKINFGTSRHEKLRHLFDGFVVVLQKLLGLRSLVNQLEEPSQMLQRLEAELVQYAMKIVSIQKHISQAIVPAILQLTKIDPLLQYLLILGIVVQ